MEKSGVLSKFEWVIVSNKIDPAIGARAPSNVKFLTGLSDVELSQLFVNSDLFLMPSLIEGFGLVYIEALSRGLPIVYTDNTGPADFCVDGIHGFKVQTSSTEDLQILMHKLASGSIDLNRMRSDCLILAGCTTWDSFRIKIFNFLEMNALR